MADVLVILGSGGHAKVLVDAVRARNPQCRIMILDDDPEAAGRMVLGVPVSGGRDWLFSNYPQAPVALGVGSNRARAVLLDWLRERGRVVETVVHPSAIISSTARVGEGAFVSAGSIIMAESKIGGGAIINTGASVDHDCEIGDATHIGPGVRLCGNVIVGERTLVGVGAAVRPGVRIGSDVVIGAGSVVISDLADGKTFVGCPARPIDSVHRTG